MKHIITLLLCMCGLLAGCGKTSLESPKGRYKFAMERLAAAQTPEQKFFALGPAAKESFEAGKVEDAQKYAQDLMVLLPDFKDSTDYGGAMSDANIVLGRVALKKGQVEEAKRYLLAAGRSPTSPYLANYGPNMGLAKDLLEKGLTVEIKSQPGAVIITYKLKISRQAVIEQLRRDNSLEYRLHCLSARHASRICDCRR